MSKKEKKLIKKAVKDHKRIYPCRKCRNLKQCFTEIENELVLWFNTEDGSTHLIK